MLPSNISMISPLFAQEQLSTVPDSFWKWFCIAILVLLGAAALVIGIIKSYQKPAPVKIDDEPAVNVRKAAKRYNHDATEIRFVAVEVTVKKHESEIEKIKDLLRIDLPAMERRIESGNETRASRIHEHIENDRKDLDKKITAMPGEIIATLKNTGAI